jgi:perosamine synthetase
VNSGTSALHAALFAIGVGPGDEIIMPAMSVVMNAYAAIALGATPIFADIDPITWNISRDTIEKVLSKKTKAVITVSWFGSPVELSPIRDLANENGFYIVEDAAESLGATYKGAPSGMQADLVTYSFESKKHLSTGGEGGMVSTSNSLLAQRARKFSGLGYKHLTADAGRTSLNLVEFQRPDYERYDTISLNYRMSPLTAAVGLGQLDDLAHNLHLRIKSGTELTNTITRCEDFIGQGSAKESTHAYYIAGMRYVGKLKWKDIYSKVIENGGDGFYGCVLNPYLEPVFKGKNSTKQIWNNGLMRIAETYQPQIMALKTNYRIDEDLQRNLQAWDMTLNQI